MENKKNIIEKKKRKELIAELENIIQRYNTSYLNEIGYLEDTVYCVHKYLDEIGIERTDSSYYYEEYSIVGRIKQLEKIHLKQISALESSYIEEQKILRNGLIRLQDAFSQEKSYSNPRRVFDSILQELNKVNTENCNVFVQGTFYEINSPYCTVCGKTKEEHIFTEKRDRDIDN